MKGQCNCGTVEFTIAQPLSDVYVCHCSICRSSTGAGGLAVVIVEKTHFTWLSGREKVNTWSKPGHDWVTSFCTCCGSPLPGENDDAHVYVPVSLLPDISLNVAHHIWVDSKASWEQIADDGVQHPKGYGSGS